MDLLSDWISEDEDLPSSTIPVKRTYQRKHVYLSPAQIRQNKIINNLKEDLKIEEKNVTVIGKEYSSKQSTQAEKKRYRLCCTVCEFKTNIAEFMYAHSRKHRRKKKVICEKCFREFYRTVDLLKHLKKIHKKLEYKCGITCNFRTTKTTILRKHIATIHETKTPKPVEEVRSSNETEIPVVVSVNMFTCNKCEYAFVKEKLLKKHRKLHEGKTCFECPICQNQFREAGDLKRVTDTEGGLFQYQCKCKCIFTLVNPFKPKLVISETERPFECTICPCKFRYPHVLHSHVKSHQERTAYQCNKCDNKFRLMAHLASHMKSHNGVAA